MDQREKTEATGRSGDLVARRAIEAIGLRRWKCRSLIEQLEAANSEENSTIATSTATSDSNTAMQFQADRSLRQMAIWAIARQSDPPQETSFTQSLAAAVYGRPSAAIDSAGFDALARAAKAQRIVEPVDVSSAICFVQSALGEPRQLISGRIGGDNASLFDGYRQQLASRFPAQLKAGWSTYLLRLADRAEQRGWPDLAREAVRAVASFAPADPVVLDLLLVRINDGSSPTDDLNVLVTIAACTFRPTEPQSRQLAAAFAEIPIKIAKLGWGIDSHWSERNRELFEALSRSDADFKRHLLGTLDSGRPVSLEWIEWLPLQQQRAAAASISKQLLATDPAKWTGPQLQVACRYGIDPMLAPKLRGVVIASLDSPLPAESSAASTPLQCDLTTIVQSVAKIPTTADYGLLIRAVADRDRTIQSAAWGGLRKLPIADPKLEISAIAILAASHARRPLDTVESTAWTARLRNVAARLRLSGVPTGNEWSAWQPVLDRWLAEQNASASVREAWSQLNSPAEPWLSTVAAAEKLDGVASRGELLFSRGRCNQCHNSNAAIGPNLSGVTRRFAHEDLFAAIYEPSRDISDRYAAVQILLEDGQIVSGILIEENDEMLKLRQPDGTVREIPADEATDRKRTDVSLMPAGLTTDWSAAELADLHAYLKSL